MSMWTHGAPETKLERNAAAVIAPPGLVGDFIEQFLAAAQRAGWTPSYDKADEEIYLLRSGSDAAQLTAADGTVRVETCDARRGEMRELIERVRDGLIADAQSVVVREAMKN